MKFKHLPAAVRYGIGIITIVSLTACGGTGGSPPVSAGPGIRQQNAIQRTASAGSAVAWQVQSGADARSGALQALAFLPGKITIDEGDSITWTNAGEPHTITLLGSYANPPGDPTAPQGAGTFDGTNFVSSGLMVPGQKYTLTFTKAGTYPYFCVLHAPEMSGVIVVQPRGTPYPQSQQAYAITGRLQELGYLAQAETAVLRLPFDAGTTIAAGTSGPTRNGQPSQATVLAFLNSDRLNSSTVTVPVGATVTWQNLANDEPHTVTFPVAGQPLPPQYRNPFAPPAGGPAYDGTSVVNSGMLNPGDSFKLTFTKPGTYAYECLFHDEEHMEGTIIVK